MKTRISIAKGNSKLGKIPNISMPPIKACGNCDYCKKDCYALKAWRMYKETRAAWTKNHKLALNDSTEYFTQIQNFIHRRQPKFFRWHASGDILDQHYLNSMAMIAELNPDTTFLCFTKMHHLDYSNVPDNLKIVFSAWPGLVPPNPNKLPVAYMRDPKIDSKIPKTARQCPGHCDTCGMCWSLKRGESVVFDKH